MKKTILALAAAAIIAASTLTAPSPADAANGRNGALIGGLAAGAIIGGAIVGSQQPRYYGPQPGYVIYRDYYEPYPTGCPGGYWARRPMHDRYGNFMGYSRPRFICP